MDQKINNYWSIDIAKLFFCICIVVTHTRLLSYLPSVPRAIINGTIVRAAVPFFFIVSGFFLGQSIEKRGYYIAIKRYVYRMLKPLIIFESIGVLINVAYMIKDRHNTFEIIITNIQEILFYPRVSMWFLQACIVGACMVYALRKIELNVQLLIGIFLFCIALLCNNYYEISEKLGANKIVEQYLNICISARNGVFYGYCFLVIGQLLYFHRASFEKWSKYKTIGLLIIAYAAYVLESLYVDKLYRADDGSLFILQLATVPLIIIALIRLAIKYPISWRGAIVCRKYSTGIYYVQKIVLYVVEAVFLVLHLTLTPFRSFCLVLMISTGLCFISYRVPVLSKIMQ